MLEIVVMISATNAALSSRNNVEGVRLNVPGSNVARMVVADSAEHVKTANSAILTNVNSKKTSHLARTGVDNPMQVHPVSVRSSALPKATAVQISVSYAQTLIPQPASNDPVEVVSRL